MLQIYFSLPFRPQVSFSVFFLFLDWWTLLLDNTRPPAQPFPQDFCDLQQHCVLMPASPGVIVVGQLLSPTYRSLSDGFVYFFPTKAVNASKTFKLGIFNLIFVIWFISLFLLTNARLQIFLTNIQHSFRNIILNEYCLFLQTYLCLLW